MDDPCLEQRAIADTKGPSYCKISWRVAALSAVKGVTNGRFIEVLVNFQSDMIIHITIWPSDLMLKWLIDF